MSRKPISQQSTAELLRQEKNLKRLIRASLFSALVLLVAGICAAFTHHKIRALTAVSTPIAVLVVINTGNLREVQKELQSR